MASDLSALLDTLIAKAPAMREAGLLKLGLPGGVTVELAPHEPKVSGDDNEEDDSLEHPDALSDPRTFPGGVVPGFKLRTKQ